MAGRIARELREHAPFTMLGALTGIAVMVALMLAKVDPQGLLPAFEGLHALHVLLSAIVTSALFMRYRKSIIGCILVGYFGSVGIATLSDVLFPHHGAWLVLRVIQEHPHVHWHLPAIEQWWLITPVALLGVAIGGWGRISKVPHSGHVLLSTWASIFYVAANSPGGTNWVPLLPLLFVVLFIAVWVPCCFSDIVFPLLFVRRGETPETAHEHH